MIRRSDLFDENVAIFKENFGFYNDWTSTEKSHLYTMIKFCFWKLPGAREFAAISGRSLQFYDSVNY